MPIFGPSKSDGKLPVNVSWLIWSLLALVGILYLGFYGYNANSLVSIFVFSLFSIMFILAFIFSRGELLYNEADNFRASSAWFVIGFMFWYIINSIAAGTGASASLFQLLVPERFFVLSTLAGDLPLFWSWFITNIVAPVVEEAFWMFGLPIGGFMVLERLGNYYPVMRNKFVQFGILMFAVTISFAFFHIAKLTTAFILAAVMFRLILTGTYWADEQYKWIPAVTVVPSMGLGAHIGNNIAESGGFGYMFEVLFNDPFGLLVLLVFILIFGTGIDKILDDILKKSPITV